MWELKRRMTSIFIIPAGHPLDFVQELHSRIKLGLEKILLPANCGQNNVPCGLEEKDYSGLRHRDLQGVCHSIPSREGGQKWRDGWYECEQVTSIMFEHDQQKRWFWIKCINQQRCIVAVYMYIYIICSDRERERERSPDKEKLVWMKRGQEIQLKTSGTS